MPMFFNQYSIRVLKANHEYWVARGYPAVCNGLLGVCPSVYWVARGVPRSVYSVARGLPSSVYSVARGVPRSVYWFARGVLGC